ncbi:pyruvate carboxyltransferase [Desulfoscipio gibsoniae]|uniref:Isopropylmalate/homocitrate/citramalate synthase n=1 Tax=Desulfoscipio gibsoniae DSM 7213 TaxID=767817 RepID=R4KHV9_9FIRM|nr:pyruvate carboxyltransferase [Desulfoscipio gibsoniae]AGL01232.1 isopropylmalate/homocitrate/citramalate synthase [Desulfoscipio gibsoniae DSM 7213]
MFSLNYPKKVVIGDITVRDGFQHEEKFIPTRAKLWCLEELILAGFKRIEVSNFGNPKGMPQFADANELFKAIHTSKRVKDKLDDVEMTAITIRERAVDRAIEAKKEGYGPNRILMMVSTSPSHMIKNSGLDHKEYWAESERCIKKAHDAGIKVCGTVSTIWGCPIEGPTELKKAVEFTKYYLDIGADDIEHADHDGSAPPDKVYEYFSMIMDALPTPELHVAHFHVTRGWGLANVLAALQAGITHFEGTMGGIGGQPTNFIGGCPVAGTGDYYYQDPNIVGLVSTEDMVVMMDEMGIDTGVDVNRVLEIGRTMEKIVGRRLRSECIKTGRIPKEPTGF